MQFCLQRGTKNVAMRELWISSCLRDNKVNNFRKRQRETETASQSNSLFQPKKKKKVLSKKEKWRLSKQKDRNQNQNQRKRRFSTQHLLLVQAEQEMVKQWKCYECSSLLRHHRVVFLTFTSGKKCQVRTTCRSCLPRPTAKPDQPVEILTGCPWRRRQGTGLLRRIGALLWLCSSAWSSLLSAPSGANLGSVSFMVVCLLILAFCESVRCHGDNHLDHSSEQGLAKWVNRTQKSIHFSAAGLPSGIQSLLGQQRGCYTASQSVLSSFLHLSMYSEHICLLLLKCP